MVLSRGSDGGLHGFVNRCAHRGVRVVRQLRGNELTHTCIYHQWCYHETGDLKAPGLQRGIKGKGGYSKDFKLEDHGMRKLRVEEYCGVVFGSLSEDAPPLRDYLGDKVCKRMEIVFNRPLVVTGYHRWTIRANWKLFAENTRDMYHAPLLHPFLPTFGIYDAGHRGSGEIEAGGAHSIISSYLPAEKERGRQVPRNAGGKFHLEDESVVRGNIELPDGMFFSITAIFPATLFTMVGNAFSIRQTRPKGLGEVETFFTYFAYADDDAEQLAARRRQINLFGPAGFVSMEDGEALELIQSSILRGEEKGESFIEFGGREVADEDHLISEAQVRGFWKTYCRYMDIPVPGNGA